MSRERSDTQVDLIKIKNNILTHNKEADELPFRLNEFKWRSQHGFIEVHNGLGIGGFLNDAFTIIVIMMLLVVGCVVVVYFRLASAHTKIDC